MFVFTGFFILFGALKSRSLSGLISFLVFVVCPILLFLLFKDSPFIEVTKYGQDSYTADGNGFYNTNLILLKRVFIVNFPQLRNLAGNLLFVQDAKGIQIPSLDYTNAAQVIFHSQIGILLMRFIAFAYTYHYLNWFSKTELIMWHKIPKARFMLVIILWVTSLILYRINYPIGLRWLYFLSFCHVLLEFPLNMVSIAGIFKESISIAKNGFTIPLKQGDGQKKCPKL